MAERKPLSKTTRFEVFKRDSFTCQYCGSKAPDVVLEIDHINPVANGGDNELMNLITSCYTCNRGKTDKLLSDGSIVEKQRKQIEELNIRRQQLEMMLQWRDENIQFKNEEVQKAIDYFNSRLKTVSLSKYGELGLSKHVKKYGLIDVLDAIDIAYDKYYTNEDDAGEVSTKIGGILNTKSMPKYRQRISYILGICKNKNFNINNYRAISLLTEYHENGYDLEKIIMMLKDGHFRSFASLMNYVEDHNLQID